ncbi:MAG TPA: FMN-binding negative transcriptional regulator [Rhizomicrobium sp.]
MYRPSAFAVDDVAVLHEVIRKRVLATLAAVVNGEVAFAYAPVVLDAGNGKGAIRFHLAAGNPLAAVKDGTRITAGFMASDAYISLDWYAQPVTVPTWNYVAVEGTGTVRRLSREDLRRQIVDMSAQEEAKLLPKPPWKMDKVAPQRLEALLNGIVGFSLPFESLLGKFKLSQNKSKEDFDGTIAGLEARGDAASLAVAKAMRLLKN